MTFRRLSPLFLIISLIFINDGASHKYESTTDTLMLPNGYVSTWEHATDASEHHDSVSAGAEANITKAPLRGRNAWHIGASGFADVYAKDIVVGWETLTPTIIVPIGLYYIHARVDKKDNKGVFRTVKFGDKNTPIYMPYSGARHRVTYAPYSEEHSNQPNINDYRAIGISYISNSAPDPRESASARASR